ncbi:MAG: YceI family protein [Steroidobacteraceae bacterium]
MSLKALAAAVAMTMIAVSANSAPETYKIDPGHTYPSFEADHNGGMSLWRGKFNSSSGTIILDTAAKTGSVEVTINMASIDFGHDRMNAHASGDAMFDVAKYPTATYKGTFSKWNGDAPTEVDGQLTMKGVTKPVKLTLNSFMCKASGLTRRMTCGADAVGTLNRDEFGVDYGKSAGFKMATKLLITVEAAKVN